MFPDFRYLIHGIIGWWPPQWMSLFKTFGLMVALSFIGATWVMIRELKRKEAEGKINAAQTKVLFGRPATITELLITAAISFLIGYKIGGFFGGGWAQIAPSPMSYILSARGNLLIGLLAAAVFTFLKYREKKKQALPVPVEKTVLVHPHERIGEIVIIAALAGIIGAKIFNALETWDNFIADPIGSLLSPSGLTFYGGFITATLVFYLFARRNKIRFAHLADAAAPAIMLAYGIGRLGCQLAGDGDWGIYNSAYVSDAAGNLAPAARGVYQATIPQALQQQTHAAYVPAGWLPQALVAQNFKHNVNKEGFTMQGCEGEYCTALPAGVFPTSLYEALAGVLLFLIMWRLRRRLGRPWQMFGLFLLFSGIERFLIEQVRVNYKYNWGFIHPTQAEIIAVCLAVIGAALLLLNRDKRVGAVVG